VRGIDDQCPAIDIDHVHNVDLTGGMVGVGAIDDIPLGPASELRAVARGEIEVGRHREIDPPGKLTTQRHGGYLGRVTTQLIRQTSFPGRDETDIEPGQSALLPMTRVDVDVTYGPDAECDLVKATPSFGDEPIVECPSGRQREDDPLVIGA